MKQQTPLQPPINVLLLLVALMLLCPCVAAVDWSLLLMVFPFVHPSNTKHNTHQQQQERLLLTQPLICAFAAAAAAAATATADAHRPAKVPAAGTAARPPPAAAAAAPSFRPPVTAVEWPLLLLLQLSF